MSVAQMNDTATSLFSPPYSYSNSTPLPEYFTSLSVFTDSRLQLVRSNQRQKVFQMDRLPDNIQQSIFTLSRRDLWMQLTKIELIIELELQRSNTTPALQEASAQFVENVNRYKDAVWSNMQPNLNHVKDVLFNRSSQPETTIPLRPNLASRPDRRTGDSAPQPSHSGRAEQGSRSERDPRSSQSRSLRRQSSSRESHQEDPSSRPSPRIDQAQSSPVPQDQPVPYPPNTPSLFPPPSLPTFVRDSQQRDRSSREHSTRFRSLSPEDPDVYVRPPGLKVLAETMARCDAQTEKTNAKIRIMDEERRKRDEETAHRLNPRAGQDPSDAAGWAALRRQARQSMDAARVPKHDDL
jgi:hypothetical protein